MGKVQLDLNILNPCKKIKKKATKKSNIKGLALLSVVWSPENFLKYFL